MPTGTFDIRSLLYLRGSDWETSPSPYSPAFRSQLSKLVVKVHQQPQANPFTAYMVGRRATKPYILVIHNVGKRMSSESCG